MATIRDVAKEAGTSIATISRILSNDDSFDVSSETRKSVLEAAKKLNYTAKTKRKKQNKLHFGCVLAVTVEKYSDPFFTSILSAAEEECVKHNAIISVIRSFQELQNEAVLSELCSLGLSGLILMENLPEDMMERLRASIPYIVAIDILSDEFNSVGFDNFRANARVMDCLIAHGYRRIACIGGDAPGDSFETSSRMAAYRDALFRNGIEYDPSLVFNCNWELDVCARGVEAMLSADRLPDAVFAGSDTLASIVLSEMYKKGLRCPDDIGVMGFNNLSTSAHFAPPLTTVDIPTKDIGATAVRRLVELISNDDGYIMKITFPTRIVLRQSLRNVTVK